MDLAGILPKTGVAVGGSGDSDLGAIVDGPSAEDLGQSLVFTNSHHSGRTATHSYAHATANSYAHAASASTTYAHAALVFIAIHNRFINFNTLYRSTYIIIFFFLLSPSQSSVLGSGFGSLNAPKQTPAPDIRTSEQLNGPRLGQRTSQMLATSSSSSVSKDAGQSPMQAPAPAPSPSADKAQGAENGAVAVQHCKFISEWLENPKQRFSF